MIDSVNNLISIQDTLKKRIKNFNQPNIIAVSKTFPLENIFPLINHGHIHYGENKVQEAIEKWPNIKQDFTNIKLHMIGKIQTNKVKHVIPLFDYIHSLDNIRLAEKISNEEAKINKKLKIFIQVNIGNEEQKSGVNKTDLGDLVLYCKKINLDVIGLMCIPPLDKNCSQYFKEINLLNTSFDFPELSLGMSSDYIEASKNLASYLRIGSSIFGKRV